MAESKIVIERASINYSEKAPNSRFPHTLIFGRKETACKAHPSNEDLAKPSAGGDIITDGIWSFRKMMFKKGGYLAFGQNKKMSVIRGAPYFNEDAYRKLLVDSPIYGWRELFIHTGVHSKGCIVIPEERFEEFMRDTSDIISVEVRTRPRQSG